MNSDLPSDSPKLDRTIAILFGVLIVTLALLFVIAGMTWAVRNELVGGLTATPTATQKAAIPPTPDFRATRFIQDALTKEAYEAVVGPVTPEVVQTRPQDVAMLPIVSMPGGGSDEAPPLTETPSPVPTPTSTPVTVGIHLPVVSNPDQTPTAGALTSVVETPTSTHTPAVTGTPASLPPTFTPTLEPTTTPLPVGPTPTETPLLRVPELRARVTSNNGATVRVGPSTIYSDTGQIGNGAEIRLWGRTASGEWVYGCCIIGDEGDEESFWVRQADAPPTENDFGDAVPTGESPDDVRWLAIQALDPTLTPMPSPTAIPVVDYPLYRRDPANQARVVQLPRPTVGLMPGWPYQSGGVFSSPVVVGGNNALALSTDFHLYSVDRLGGNQRWKKTLENNAQYAPAIVGENVYVVDDRGVLYNYALQSGELRWRVELNATPVNGINIADKYLFFTIQRGNEYWLKMHEQEDGEFVREFKASGPSLQYPAIGDQLIYIANEEVWALDIFDGLTEVWTYEGINNATAPPLYIRPGVRAAAELYIAGNDNRVISLDANTGGELWVYESNEPVTGMAADEERLYLSGNDFIKAISRRDHEDRWRELTNGPVLGGPIVGDGEVLTLTENGDIGYWDAEDGARIYNNTDVKRFLTSGAVGGEQIYIIGQGGMMYGFRGGGE